MKTVLVIDDQPSVQALVDATLSRTAEYRVLCAGSAEEAVQLAREGTPDLIILDVLLPGKDGISLSRDLKSDPFTAQIPILVISGLSPNPTRQGSDLAFADGFLPKPFTPAELLTLVTETLKGRSKD